MTCKVSNHTAYMFFRQRQHDDNDDDDDVDEETPVSSTDEDIGASSNAFCHSEGTMEVLSSSSAEEFEIIQQLKTCAENALPLNFEMPYK